MKSKSLQVNHKKRSKKRLNVIVYGATGRIGKILIEQITNSPDLRLVAALASKNNANLGSDIGEILRLGKLGIKLSSEKEFLLDATTFSKHIPDCLVDFSTNLNLANRIKICKQTKCSWIIGTTGLAQKQHAQLHNAAKHIAILQATNMSIGVQLLRNGLSSIQTQLGKLQKDNPHLTCDLELIETHHRHKRDHPSGTALDLAQLAVDNQDGISRASMQQQGPKPTEQITVHSVRTGNIAGTHEMLISIGNEYLSLKHVALGRELFADGALLAIRFLASRPAGLYSFADALA